MPILLLQNAGSNTMSLTHTVRCDRPLLPVRAISPRLFVYFVFIWLFVFLLIAVLIHNSTVNVFSLHCVYFIELLYPLI